MGFIAIAFELDSKLVVAKLKLVEENVSKLGSTLKDCFVILLIITLIWSLFCDKLIWLLILRVDPEIL